MTIAEAAAGQELPADREVLDWDLFGTAIRELAQAVADSGFAPDVVVAVARGGLPVGGAMSYALGTKAVGTDYEGLYGEDGKHHETNVEAKYVLQDGPAKDLSFRIRQSWHRANADQGEGDIDEFRLIVDYPLSVL